MKHETINTLIGILALGVASFQYWPKSDRLELVSEGRVETGQKLQIEPLGAFNPNTAEPTPSAGPVTWKIRVYNDNERDASIVSIDVFVLDEQGRRAQYSGMNTRLSPFDPSLSLQNLPEDINARSTRAYLLSLFIPIADEPNSNGPKCRVASSIDELERCYFLSGIDLFGNEVDVIKYGDEIDDPISVSWKGIPKGPKFEIVLGTADGSEFVQQLAYFPLF